MTVPSLRRLVPVRLETPPPGRVAQPSSAARSAKLPRYASRGFTLVEMMVVVTIIALFAAIAAPSVIHLLRDQRTVKTANQVLGLYREARGRAIGRGAAVMVQFKDNGDILPPNPPGPLFTVREAIDASGLPNPHCTAANWVDLYSVGAGRTNGDLSSTVHLYQNSQTYNDAAPPPPLGINQLCFTPNGRSFTRNALAGSFTPLVARTTISFERNEPGSGPTGIRRLVFVNVDGTSRFVQR